jgi:hypothetical protein
MGNGFIVYITNNTGIEKEVKLCSNTLPEGLLVQTPDNAYEFNALQIMAMTRPFTGNSVTTNSDEAIKIAFVRGNQKENVALKGRYEKAEIRINGNDEFISVMCPPNEKFYIRLNSLPPEII